MRRMIESVAPTRRVRACCVISRRDDRDGKIVAENPRANNVFNDAKRKEKYKGSESSEVLQQSHTQILLLAVAVSSVDRSCYMCHWQAWHARSPDGQLWHLTLG
jgi:hypothetical protein